MNQIEKIHRKHCIAIAVASAIFSPTSQASDVDVSGFITIGGGVVEDSKLRFAGYDEEDLMLNRNVVGLQVSGSVNERITATVQLVSRSQNDYQVDAEWGYLTWQLTDNSKLRAGRLRTPLYIYSDFLDVGYAYPWISAPNAVYYLPFNTIEGIDYYTTMQLGSFDTSFQAYYGGFDTEFKFEDGQGGIASLRKAVGVIGTFGKDWWNIRAAFHQGDTTGTIYNDNLNNFIKGLEANQSTAYLASRLALDGDYGTYKQIGFNIDTGRFVAAAEHVEFEIEDSLLSKNVRDYAMVGVRFGDFLFHVTGSKADDEAAQLSAGIPRVPQTQVLIATLNNIAAARVVTRDVISYGTRWDVSSGTALKFQFDDVDDVRGKQKVYSVALQAVF